MKKRVYTYTIAVIVAAWLIIGCSPLELESGALTATSGSNDGGGQTRDEMADASTDITEESLNDAEDDLIDREFAAADEPQDETSDIAGETADETEDEVFDEETAAKIRAIGHVKDFLDIEPENIKYLTEEQISDINNYFFEQFSDEQAAALTEEQVQAINTGKVKIGNLPEEKRDYLTAEQIQAITNTGQFQYIPTALIPELTEEQISTLNDYYFSQLSEEQKAALTEEQIQALNTAKVKISRLTEEQRELLTTEQIKAISNISQISYVPGELIPEITPEQISTLNDYYFSQLSEEQKAALTEEQIQALNTAKVKISRLTEEQRELLTAEQIQAISNISQISYVPEELIPEITPEQISTLNDYYFSQLSEEQKAALTEEQIQALNTAGVKISRLTEEQRELLTAEQIRALDTSQVKISRLSEEQRELLTPEQIKSITNISQFRYIPVSLIPELTPEQISGINDSTFVKFSKDQLAALTNEQIAAIDRTKVKEKRIPGYEKEKKEKSK